MRPYRAYFAARFRTQLQYREAALAGVGTQIFFGLVNVMVLTGFYAASSGPHPLSYEQAISYIWLGQALLLILPFRPDREVQELIRTGNVAYELARPVSVVGVWIVRGLADRTAPVLLRAVPQLLFSIFILRWLGAPGMALGPPASVAAGFTAAASALAGACVAAAIGVTASATLFWTIAAQGTSALFGAAIWILSGVTIPLPLFPDWVQPVFALLPFRAMVDVPFRIYLGTIAGTAAVAEIALQLAWFAALILLARLLVGRGMRRLVVQGG